MLGIIRAGFYAAKPSERIGRAVRHDEELWGKLFGDRGYNSQALTALLQAGICSCH